MSYFFKIAQKNITPKHKTHARACALNTKTNKIKKVTDVKVEN